MKQSTKTLYGFLGIVLAVGGPLGVWALRPKGEATVRLANGIEVTPIDVQPDDTARVLDVKVWKFDVLLPDTEHGYLLTLNQYQRGKSIAGPSLGGGGFGPIGQHGQSRLHHLTLGMAPLGRDFSHATQVKYILEDSAGGGTAGSTSGVFANPLKVLPSLGEGVYVSGADNRVYLMGGGKVGNAPAGRNDVDIALDIKPGAIWR